jgi:hypothetical protein
MWSGLDEEFFYTFVGIEMNVKEVQRVIADAESENIYDQHFEIW